jgi:multidrug efflux pump subunit AcrB/outer membrane protein TolC
MRSVIRWLVDHSTTVFIAAVAVFVFGVLAWITLPRESSPDITIPVVIVSTPYVGVSPADVENLVSVPIENELASLRGIDKLTSTSAEGVSIVAVEFEPDSDIEDALQRVRDRVSRARAKLPTDVEESSVREISFSDIPVVLINIAGPVDEEKLKQLAEDLEEDLTRVDGVLDVKLTGGKEREVQVHVIPERLAHYGLSLRDVVGAIDDENVNIPGGNVDLGRGNVLLRVPGEFDDPRQIEGVAIKRVGDQPVFVRDVARVVDGFAERETYSRMAGQPSVTLAVTKRAGANILEVASKAKAVSAEHAETWPEGVYFRALGDESKAIEQSVSDLQNNIITALLLVVGVIVFFMGVRPSLFVAISIPMSMFGAMLVLQSLGFTLNMVVLFALILALGMLVDNAIVVVENVYRHAEMGKGPREASIDGTAEVAVAVAASTATTVAAFFPLVFWTGIMGEFMGFMPKTIIIVLTMSLVVAVGVLPVVMSKLMPRLEVREGADAVDPKLREADLGRIMGAYRSLLRASIRWRYVSAALGVVLFIITFLIYVPFNHGTEFFPESEPDRAIIGVRLPEGTTVESTDRVVRELEAMLAAEPNVDTWVAESGVSAGGDALSGTSTRPSEARITVDFLPSSNNAEPGETVRAENTKLTVDRLRATAQQLPGTRITVEPAAMGPPVGDPIKVEVSGDDYDEVGAFAQKLRRRIAQVDGTTDLRDDYVVGRPELRLRIDRGAAKRVGVSTAAVGDAVRNAIAGTVATSLRDGEDEIDVVVELAPEYREDIQSVLGLRLPGREDTSPNTFPVPISTVASYELVGGSGSIQHIDQDLVVTIVGDVLDGYNENEVRAAVAEVLAEVERPRGIALSLTGANEEQEESMIFLLRAFAIACCLILLVLVTQFDSVAMPFIILATVILSLVGVLWGLLLTGTPFGIIMTGLGVISLAGVVVNNAIVLLDYVQQLLARGLSTTDALVEAGLTRFRPVMLTAITTTLGLVPMAVGVAYDFLKFKLIVGSASAQWWGPMAVAVIFGLSFATLLTLVMVPTLYSIYDDLSGLPQKVRSLFSRKEGEGQAEAATAAGVTLLLIAALAPAPASALTLEQALDSAADHNLDLQLARERVREQSTVVGQAWASLSPQASINAQYVINNQEIVLDFEMPDIPGVTLPESEPTVVQEKEFWQGDLTVSQRLFSGPALPALKGSYKLRDAARADLQRIEQQTEQRVVAVYYQLLTAEQQLAVAEQGVALAEAQQTLADRQVAAGLTDRRALVQAQLAMSQAQRDLDGARQALVDARQTFALTTGIDDPGALEVPEPMGVPTDVEAALVDAKVRRPDLESASLRRQALQAERTGQYLRFLPVVDGIFTYNYTENTGFNDQNWTWRLVFQGTWTIWDGGFSTVERAATSSRLRQARLQEELVGRQAEREVRVAFEAYRRAASAYDAVQTELELARENLELAERTYAAGSSSWLELEQAKLQLQSTELVGLRERMARDLAAMDLKLATGTL